jgi:hypothetical protein
VTASTRRRRDAVTAAIGQMRIVNIPIPAFDPDDEWFDEPAA